MSNEDLMLAESIHVTAIITCSSCKKTQTEYELDTYEVIDVFKEDGWRATRHGNIYCSKCAKKKLK